MLRILLLNPNTSEATTEMMTAIARKALPPRMEMVGLTARQGVPMIVDEQRLWEAGVEITRDPERILNLNVAGVIISAFGDPGIDTLRFLLPIPIVGIFEASALEASAKGRKFGIATVTPGLVDVLAQKAEVLGIGRQFTGTRLTEGDPEELASHPVRLEQALGRAVARCFDEDGAEAVIIGGGPLGQAAIGLAARFRAPVIAPIPAAVRQMVGLLQKATPAG